MRRRLRRKPPPHGRAAKSRSASGVQAMTDQNTIRPTSAAIAAADLATRNRFAVPDKGLIKSFSSAEGLYIVPGDGERARTGTGLRMAVIHIQNVVASTSIGEELD